MVTAKLWQLDAEQTFNALSIAASHISGSTEHTSTGGSITPLPPNYSLLLGQPAFAEMKRLRKGITLGGAVTIRQLIEEGRKY